MTGLEDVVGQVKTMNPTTGGKSTSVLQDQKLYLISSKSSYLTNLVTVISFKVYHEN